MKKARSLSELILRWIGTLLGRILYRVTTHGWEHTPKGGFLLLPNHLTWVDAVVLQLSSPRPIRFIVFESIYKLPALNFIFRAMGALPIAPKAAKETMRTAADLIRAGEIVCIFPEGELSRSGLLLRLKRGCELLARQAHCPVVPVWLDRLWGSIFSFSGGKYFFKIPRAFPYPVTVAYGMPIPHDKADIATVRERFLELGEFCYSHRPTLEDHLGRACVRGLKARAGAQALVDGMDGSTLTRGMLLAAGAAFSRYILRECPHHRIGVVLPPGKAAFVANLAIVLAGKVPVNLNFTAGRASVESACRIANLRHCITGRIMEKRLTDFPWPEHIMLMDELLPPLKPSIILWRVIAAILPAWLFSTVLGIPTVGDRDEAVLLFTSGSSGEPKGVVLSHRNLLGNVAQFGEMLNLDHQDAIMANLPFSHSFGSTVTLWFPMIEGVETVTYPNPLDFQKNAKLIREHCVTIFITTPTFLRGYLRSVEPEMLTSLELVVTGAERLPDELANAFQEKFGKEVFQGYGLTETAPVVSVNLPEPKLSRPSDTVQPSNRRGSVGKPAPGMAVSIRNPESDLPLPLHETGMIWLRGPNIFEGYLDDPTRTSDVIINGWFRTGDLGRMDEDGFLYIEGRLSRFSKIGGEMVPHERIETCISEALALPTDRRMVAVTAIPDTAKGEALVLLTIFDVSTSTLREKLSAAGLPNLWIPKSVCLIESLPLLSSGKLDLRQCKEIALEWSQKV